MTSLINMLEAKWDEGKHVCVGLDPVVEKLPEDLKGGAILRQNQPALFMEDVSSALGEAMVRIINVTYDIAAAYKPNSAFYECYGAAGWNALARVIKHAQSFRVPVILDAKRGDIGTTNERYAAMAFDILGADAITIHPYLGWQANKPFLDRADKGIFVLCRTSNPGASEFQDMEVPLRSDVSTALTLIPSDDKVIKTRGDEFIIWSQLFRRVAEHVGDPETWNTNGNCGLVTGATYPQDIITIRKIAQNLPLLIPGIGKQGGDLEASVRAARHRFLINSSSGIIFADDPRQETSFLDQRIRQIHESVM